MEGRKRTPETRERNRIDGEKEKEGEKKTWMKKERREEESKQRKWIKKGRRVGLRK